jgi:hypothetical protein
MVLIGSFVRPIACVCYILDSFLRFYVFDFCVCCYGTERFHKSVSKLLAEARPLRSFIISCSQFGTNALYIYLRLYLWI